MWMQILEAAGVPIFGKKFPGKWKDTIEAANSKGFYESVFRSGINFRTNPLPGSGEYLHPDDVRGTAVKVFVPGLTRTDRAFIDRVLVTMRPFREYHHSILRLYAMEHENKQRASEEALPPLPTIDPTLEWWSDNFGAIQDVLLKRLPAHFMSYHGALSDPNTLVREALGWLEIEGGDLDAGVAVVTDGMRTQRDVSTPDSPGIDDAAVAIFDELFQRIHERAGLDGDFIDALNDLNEKLEPLVIEARREVFEARRALDRDRKKRRAASLPEGSHSDPEAAVGAADRAETLHAALEHSDPSASDAP